MKKVIFMAVMLFTMSVNVFADNNNAEEVQRIERYDIKVSTSGLSRFLELSKDQEESVATITENLSKDLMFAAVECNETNRKAVTKNAIMKNTTHMRYVLNRNQYLKYLKVLNVTIQNRGIEY